MDYTLFRGGRHPNSESGARPVPGGIMIPINIPITLEYLRWHWGTAYDIWRSGDRWGARNAEDLDADALRATSGRQLLGLIRADYRARAQATLTAGPQPLKPGSNRV